MEIAFRVDSPGDTCPGSGIVNTAFFDGDILFSYAIYGLVLIPLSYLPTKWLWWVVAFLFIQPVNLLPHFGMAGGCIGIERSVWKYV